MSDCTFQPDLGPYYDGELDAGGRARFERHLDDCPSCAAELASLRDLSARIFAATAAPPRADLFTRMHRAVSREAEKERAGAPLLRTAGLLAALAASVLIVGGVWLLDTARDPQPTGGATSVVALAPDWERVATTLRADPRIRPGADDLLFSPRYAAAIDWMLEGLMPAGAPTRIKSWANPNSF